MDRDTYIKLNNYDVFDRCVDDLTTEDLEILSK